MERCEENIMGDAGAVRCAGKFVMTNNSRRRKQKLPFDSLVLIKEPPKP